MRAHPRVSAPCGGMARLLTAAGIVLAIATSSRSAVLCAKPRQDGTFSSSVKIRQACKRNEVQLQPEAVGFCCGATTVTTSSATSSSCPATTTTTTLSRCDPQDPACFFNGVCTNGHTCSTSSGQCACDGPPPVCGQWGVEACGGTCPTGQTCVLGNTAPPSCPQVLVCECVAAP
jgi:hypothetical protein